MNFPKNIFKYQKSYNAGLLQSKAFRILKKRTNDSLRPFGVNATDWGILGLLYESKSGYTLKTIAIEVGVKPPFVTRSIRNLVEKGYVCVAADEVDARIKIAHLTTEGKVFVKKTEKVVMKAVLSLLQPAGIRNVVGYVETMASIVDRADKDTLESVDLDHMSE